MDRDYIPFPRACVRNLYAVSDEDLLEQLYCCLRWINYFQDEDNRYLFIKIYDDVHEEVKKRNIKYTWTNKDVKKFRIMGQRMYYGALSYKELEWRLGCIILYSIPVCRNFVRGDLYLVRETIHIIIDCIHDLGAWSYLEYNQDVIATLDEPFFSIDYFCLIFRVLKGFFFLSENILIFFLFLFETVVRTFNPVLHIIGPEYGSWKNLLKIFMALLWFASNINGVY